MHAYLQKMAEGGEVAETEEAADADAKACPTCGKPMVEGEEIDEPKMSFSDLLKGRGK